MKIAIFSTMDIEGGAAKASYGLYRALRAESEDVFYLVNKSNLIDPSIICVERGLFTVSSLVESFFQILYINNNRSQISNSRFSISLNNAKLANLHAIAEADILNLHWIEKYLSNENLAYLSHLKKPIVWTLHDERAYTGGCHYTSGCQNFINNNCSNCIQLKRDPFHIPSSQIRSREQALLNANLTIVSPSKWLANEARKSSVFSNRRIEVIPYSVDVDVFHPLDKQKVKSQYGIDKNTCTILFIADNLSVLRKGFLNLIEALNHCREDQAFEQATNNKSVVLLVAGGNTVRTDEIPIPVMQVGFINDLQHMVEIYNLAECLVMPSLEDNLPNTVLESMACGTPVVGYDTGGIPDIVEDHVNGLLVESGNSRALSNAILEYWRNSELAQKLSRNCRARILSRFTPKHQAHLYKTLFRELVNDNHI